ncbi:endolytic transglycosylase MltG [Ornithobacterium rhinotracheale]|uniref:endolytic transglycosylase MltG n=1 Tax=Ornithobacterium rhinotracheale TaxID=28251 RepID=UPI0040351EA2
MMKKTYFLGFLFSFLLFQSCGYFYKSKSLVKEKAFLYIPENATYQSVLDSIAPHLENIDQFDAYARTQDYDKNIKAGRYELNPEMSNEDLVNVLKSGKQSEVKIRIPNSPTIFHLARDASKGITADSASIVEAILNNPRVKENGLDMETAKIYFIPDTYNFFWITSGKDFVDRMLKEYDKFWNEKRKQQLKDSGMTELEVYTLASIVQMESPKPDEQARVAGAYLNRLKQGKKLEADPTSVYAYKLQHGFTQKVQRVYQKHLKTLSAYNTYLNYGLPPAPICLPNTTAIDAVLKPEKHDYIFFCADPDRPGYHNFTNSYAEHQKNAAKYRQWLKENNIK